MSHAGLLLIHLRLDGVSGCIVIVARVDLPIVAEFKTSPTLESLL